MPDGGDCVGGLTWAGPDKETPAGAIVFEDEGFDFFF
jgi:hypothetical protein